MSSTTYDRAFYEKITDGAQLSAREVVPYLIDLLQPKSVVDVGCGTGAWLSVFREHDIEDVFGIDGDYVDRHSLLIPHGQFLAVDLRHQIPIARQFDLVLSLEVAEHIPASHTDIYLRHLESLGDVIAFSAAVPNQGGQGHVNEQWPEYWKELFEARGFILVDALRHRIWNNRNVERWYRQNLVLYVKKTRLVSDAALQKEYENSKDRVLSLIHPATYAAPSLSSLLHMVPGTLSRAIQRRWGRKT
jgi:SAM-dependent methyltransferase